MNWVPIALGVFKLAVLGTTIYFAIKSHRDGEKEEIEEREKVKLAGSIHSQSAPLMTANTIESSQDHIKAS